MSCTEASQHLDQRLCGEDVVAHRRVRLVGAAGQAGRIVRLLEEGTDLAVLVGIDDAEAACLVARHADPGHRHRGLGLDVLLDHLPGVHPVDVVGPEHDDVVGLVVVDQVETLEDRVGAAGEPVRAEALLRGHRGHVVAEDRRHPPRRGDVPVQRVGLVLGEHGDPEVAGIHQVGQHEVDEPVRTAERNGRLGAVSGQRPQPLSLTARENNPEDTRVAPHGLTLTCGLCEWEC